MLLVVQTCDTRKATELHRLHRWILGCVDAVSTKLFWKWNRIILTAPPARPPPPPAQLPLVAPEPPLQTPGGLRNVVWKTQTWFKFPSCLKCKPGHKSKFFDSKSFDSFKRPFKPKISDESWLIPGDRGGGVRMLWAPVLPSMSRRCMMMASSTSLGMYPRERMAMPSSCLEMKPFPSRSRTRKASRISTTGKQRKANGHKAWLPAGSPAPGRNSAAQLDVSRGLASEVLSVAPHPSCYHLNHTCPLPHHPRKNCLLLSKRLGATALLHWNDWQLSAENS